MKEEAMSQGVRATAAAAAAAMSLQSCPTLCDPIDGSPPGSAVPGILQARTLEWGAIAFSEGQLLESGKIRNRFSPRTSRKEGGPDTTPHHTVASRGPRQNSDL